MQIPFTAEQFYGVFRDYNDAVWPAQVFLVALALAAIALALSPQRSSGVGVSAILGFLWAWTAVGYHLAFFTRISSPAYAIAIVSLAGLRYSSGRALFDAGSSSAGRQAGGLRQA